MAGALFDGDWEALRESLLRVIGRFAPDRHDMLFAEVGIGLDSGTGATSRDAMDTIRSALPPGVGFRYYGIDAFTQNPFVGDSNFIFINELSHVASLQVPRGLHWVFVDACHCKECVSRDIVSYANLVAVGGEIAFHDASLPGQGVGPQDFYPSGHATATAARGTAVREALDALMVGRPDFTLVVPAPRDQQLGGVEIYQRVR